MVECTRKFEDKGIAADLLHYHESDEELTHINTQIYQLQLDSTTANQTRSTCKQWLEASWCAEGLAHLKGLAPKSAYAKWTTHFNCDEEDESEG
jgi:hypothetical protein